MPLTQLLQQLQQHTQIDEQWIGNYFKDLMDRVYARNHQIGYFAESYKRRYPAMDPDTTNRVLEYKRSKLPALTSEEQRVLASYLHKDQQFTLVTEAQTNGAIDYHIAPAMRVYGQLQ